MSDSTIQVLKPRLTLPLLPLKDIVVFPHMIVPVFISEDLCMSAVEKSLADQRKIFLSAFSVANSEAEGLNCSLEAPFDVYDVGTVCSIMRTRKLPDGRMKVLVQGLSKGTITQLTQKKPYPVVEINAISEPTYLGESSDVEALVRAVRENLEKIVSLGKVLSPDILMILEDVSEPGRLADLVAANLGLKVEEAQTLLSVNEPIDRLRRVHKYLSREIEVFQMQVRIQSQAKEEIGRMQREHYLREQIRALKTELGDTDPKDELDALWAQLESKEYPNDVKEEITRQLRRLERMHQDSSEATLTRTHAETLLNLPWAQFTKENLQIKKVKQVLEEDHYGLEQVKDRIIEYLAVKKLNPQAKSPIMCFVGPPGVGKTSLGKSIARAIGRKFARIALGGLRDEAEIRGHRKTYVGAYPGRVVQAIKSADSCNPLVMLDEIDKLGSDHRGDPCSTLLEVLDPEQNKEFVDHYLGVPLDLSKVMFIANANNVESIPHPLRDRLEIIEISGYSEEEKIIIADEYLIPKQLKEAGLEKEGVEFSRTSLKTIINTYTRESGLRGLERQIAAICRKIARQVAEEADEKPRNRKKSKVKLTPSIVQRHLGAGRFNEDFFNRELTPGVCLGLAYTQFGGEVLSIETNLIPSKQPKLELTGQLGDVMKESAQAAFSFIRSRASVFGFDPQILSNNEIHIHVPAGAIPKDGPSAGITIATSILSAITGRPPCQGVAMTGEITLHGKVLPIGGLKEKLLAAQRQGLKTVIIPAANKPNYEELPQSIKKRIEVCFVKDYVELLSTALEPKAKGKGVGKKRALKRETARLAS